MTPFSGPDIHAMGSKTVTVHNYSDAIDSWIAGTALATHRGLLNVAVAAPGGIPTKLITVGCKYRSSQNYYRQSCYS